MKTARPDLADVLPKIKVNTRRPRPASDLAYWSAMADSPERTALILSLAREAGLRRGEIATLALHNIITEDPALIVHGKGNKERYIPITEQLLFALQHWAQEAAVLDWVFPGQINGHLSPRWIGHLAHVALQQTATLHRLRHSFATQGYRRTHDLLAMQRLLGHESPATTQIYADPADDAMRKAVEAAKPFHSFQRELPL